MPFRSAKQRRWMWANRPDIAKRWSKKYGSKVGGGKSKKQRSRRK